MPTSPRGLPAEPPRRRSPAQALVESTSEPAATQNAAAKSVRPSKRLRRLSLDLDAALVDQLRDAVVYLQHHGKPETTLAGVATDALTATLNQLRLELGLQAFPPRGESQPKIGRRPDPNQQ